MAVISLLRALVRAVAVAALRSIYRIRLHGLEHMPEGGGLLVAPDDPSALAEGLFKLWDNRPRAREPGQRGSEGVRKHYSIAHATDRLLDAYQRLVTSGSLAC